MQNCFLICQLLQLGDANVHVQRHTQLPGIGRERLWAALQEQARSQNSQRRPESKNRRSSALVCGNFSVKNSPNLLCQKYSNDQYQNGGPMSENICEFLARSKWWTMKSFTVAFRTSLHNRPADRLYNASKKNNTLFMSITSRKIDRFSKFFHW